MEKITYRNANGDSISFANSAPFYLESIDANSVGTAYSTQKAIGQDGQDILDITYNPRTVVAKLAFCGIKNGRYDEAAMHKNWLTISRVLIPNQAGTLIYQNDAGIYKIAYRPSELPNFTRSVGTLCRFSVDFTADYPFWKSYTDFTARLGTVVGGKRYPVIYNPALRYGEWVMKAAIKNDCGIPTPFAITIESVSTYAKIINQRGEYLYIDQVTGEGEKLVIDTENYTVTLIQADGTEVLANHKITLDSSYFRLYPGINILTLENGEDSAAKATVAYNQLYLGV